MPKDFFKKAFSKVGEFVPDIDVNGVMDKASKITDDALNVAGEVASVSVDKAKEIASKSVYVAKDIVDGTVQAVKKIEVPEITPEDVLLQAVKIPGVKIDRSQFLKKELIKYYSEKDVNLAIDRNPAFAGIEREKINIIASQIIDYETNKVSAISFAAGIPGGFAMAATIPADVAQYFGFMLRVMQKLAYLYGFSDFELDGDSISDSTMNNMLLFLGVMFGVQGAAHGVKIVAETATRKVSTSLAQKALTKGTIYPIVRKVATTLGFKMTKDIFAKGVSKVVPIVGGVVSGGLTYATFKTCANKLKDDFKELKLSDPNFYRAIEIQ
jgi:hypothetical protein